MKKKIHTHTYIYIHTYDQKEHALLPEIQWRKELLREECQANRLVKSENSDDQPSMTCTTI